MEYYKWTPKYILCNSNENLYLTVDDFFFSFFLVPPLEGREKPIITYIGDTGVMVCKTEYHALGWNWYMTNGTELVRSPSVGQAKQCDKKRSTDTSCFTTSSKNSIFINFSRNLYGNGKRKSVIFTSIHCYRDVVFWSGLCVSFWKRPCHTPK